GRAAGGGREGQGRRGGDLSQAPAGARRTRRRPVRGDRVPSHPPARHRSTGRGGTGLRAAGLPHGVGDLAALGGPAALPPRRRTRVRGRVPPPPHPPPHPPPPPPL